MKYKSGNFQAMASKWSSGLQGSTEAIKAGIQNPKQSPTQAAVAAKDRMVSQFNASVTDKTWENNITRSGDAGWRDGILKTGLARLATGAAKGQQHWQAFAAQYGPAIEAQKQTLPARGDFATNQQRSAALNGWAHSQKGKYRKLWRGGAGG